MTAARKAGRAIRALIHPVTTTRINKRELEYLDQIRRNRKFIFITGMHRSGTTFLNQFILKQCNVSGFEGIPGAMDEGQFVQNVLPTESDFGGMGYFGYHPRSRMFATSEQRNREIGASLLKDWLVYLDRNAPCFLEKTPMNFRICRLLASVFPNSSFIHVVRHPVATALALKAFSPRAIGVGRRPLPALINHWHHCQSLALYDYSRVQAMGNPVIIAALEDFPLHAARFSDALNRRLNLEFDHATFQTMIDSAPNQKYVEAYDRLLSGRSSGIQGRAIERATSLFGYSPRDITAAPDYLQWFSG